MRLRHVRLSFCVFRVRSKRERLATRLPLSRTYQSRLASNGHILDLSCTAPTVTNWSDHAVRYISVTSDDSQVEFVRWTTTYRQHETVCCRMRVWFTSANVSQVASGDSAGSEMSSWWPPSPLERLAWNNWKDELHRSGLMWCWVNVLFGCRAVADNTA
jgi:hypothetical protein